MSKPRLLTLVVAVACVHLDYSNHLFVSRPIHAPIRVECMRAAIAGVPGAHIDDRQGADSGLWVRVESVIKAEEFDVAAWVGVAPADTTAAAGTRLWAAYGWTGGGQPKAWEKPATLAAIELVRAVGRRCVSDADSTIACEYVSKGSKRKCPLY